MTKPYVICHMCTTIDGKILTERWGNLPSGKNGASLFESTADQFGIGAWIVGTTTMKEFAGRDQKLKPTGKITRGDHVADSKARRFAIGADAKGVLRFQKGDVDGDHVVLLVTQRASDKYLGHLQEAGVSYLICGKKEVDLPTAMDKLCRTFGIKKLLLEGGGKFNGSVLAAGLVDEISQIVVSIVDGGMGVSGIFDIEGKPAHAAAGLKFMSEKKLNGGVRWVRYRVTRK